MNVIVRCLFLTIFTLSLYYFKAEILSNDVCSDMERLATTQLKSEVKKRSLIFEGTGVVKLVLGVGYPIQINIKPGMLAYFYNLQMQYVPPNRPIYWWSFYNSSTFTARRGGNNYYDISRRFVYSLIEYTLERYGISRSCLLKAICEVSQHPFETTNSKFSVYERILNLVFTPAYPNIDPIYQKAYHNGRRGKQCSQVYRKCCSNILEFMSADY